MTVTTFNITLRLLLIAGLIYINNCGAEQTRPEEVVRATVNAVLATLHDDTLDDTKKKQRVADIVSEHFDFQAMTSRVLATNWKRASGTEKLQITKLFRQRLIDTYWQKFSGFSDETVEFLKQQARGDSYVSCPTIVHMKSTRIPVDYKLYRVGGEWFAYDVVIEQVSLVRNYRSKFQSIVRSRGIPGLIDHLKESAN